MAGIIRTELIDDRILSITLDNPPANAMSQDMLTLFEDILTSAQQQLNVRAIVLTGSGRAFCGGADLKQVGRSEKAGEGLGGFGRVLELVASSRPPVIAAVNGYCIGGGLELALCCDLRIASTAATFVCAGVNVGLMASTYRLPRLIGVSRAKAMLLTGLPFEANQAEAWGVVTAVHAPDQLLNAAIELAKRIASRAPLSVEAAKRVADRAIDMSPDDARDMIAREMPILLASRDHREAIAAFAGKRDPVFSRT